MSQTKWLNRTALTITFGMALSSMVACGPSSAYRSNAAGGGTDAASQLVDDHKMASDAIASSGLHPASAGGLFDNLGTGTGPSLANLPASCQSLNPSKIEDLAQNALAKLQDELAQISGNVNNVDPSALEAEMLAFKDELQAGLDGIMKDIQACAQDLGTKVSSGTGNLPQMPDPNDPQFQLPDLKDPNLQIPNLDDLKNQFRF